MVSMWKLIVFIAMDSRPLVTYFGTVFLQTPENELINHGVMVLRNARAKVCMMPCLFVKVAKTEAWITNV